MNLKNFSPLVFLASLGAGGISIIPFVLMQYTVDHGAGLITKAQLWANEFSGLVTGYYISLEAIMIIFGILHIVLTIIFSTKLFPWLKTKDFRKMINDPLKNSTILAPLISILMTMNVIIGPLRYFMPSFSSNFQSLMMPAMIFWTILFVFIIWLEIKLLETSFKEGFDIEKINFGWLLHPFLLGMLTVVGTGIAAMAQNINIANTAAFLSMISGSMGIFLLSVKLIVIFKSHFAAKGLPERQFLPSFLIVVPNITLFAISAYRFAHFLESHHGFNLEGFSYMVMGLSFAFEIWYLLFGISLLRTYFKHHHFNEFYVTQWGFICPLVGFVVLGGFVYKLVLQSPILYGLFIVTILAAIIFYVELLIKHYKCSRKSNQDNCKV